MRTYTNILVGLVLSLIVVVAAGCGQDESAPPANNRDLGTEAGEVLVPYPAAVNRKSKLLVEPSQFPMPAMPALVTAEAPAGGAGQEAQAAAARQVVTDLAAGEYEKVVGLFDETMKSQLPAAQVQATWEALVNQAGAFGEVSGVRSEQAQGMDVVVVTCKFERGSIDVKVVFNAEKQVAGLFMTPAETAQEGQDAPVQ